MVVQVDTYKIKNNSARFLALYFHIRSVFDSECGSSYILKRKVLTSIFTEIVDSKYGYKLCLTDDGYNFYFR